MSTTASFDSEIKKYFAVNKSEVSEFINEKYKKSNYKTYHDFFDDFLYNYGVISFNSSPVDFGRKNIPYLNCAENNLFSEKKGVTNLNEEPLSRNQCLKLFAGYFIKKIDSMELKTITEWNFDNS